MVNQKQGRKLTTVNVDPKLHKLGQENMVRLDDAVDFGLRFRLAQRGKLDYPFEINEMMGNAT